MTENVTTAAPGDEELTRDQLLMLVKNNKRLAEQYSKHAFELEKQVRSLRKRIAELEDALREINEANEVSDEIAIRLIARHALHPDTEGDGK